MVPEGNDSKGGPDWGNELDWRLDTPSLAAFGSVLNPAAPGMIAVATLAGTFAAIDHGRREIVIDKRALLTAIWAYAPRANVNAAVSLINGLTALDLHIRPDLFPPRHPPTELVSLFEKGYPIILSTSLRSPIIPMAQAIARLTVNRDIIDLRHLVMAFLYRAIDLLELVTDRVTDEMRIALRRSIVAPLEKSRERGEKISVWRQLIDNYPAELEGNAPPSEGPTTDETTPAPPPPPPPSEHINLQLGDPSQVDMLDRKPFADVLGDRINQVYSQLKSADKGQNKEAFVIHLHGPWGSGKSTILNFLRDRLEKGEEGTVQPKWLVVDFNAWKLQRLKPAWWAIMTQIQQMAEAAAATRWERLKLKARWQGLRFRLSGLSQQIAPILLSAGLIALSYYLFVGSGPTSADPENTPAKTLGTIVAAVAGAAAIYNIFRTVLAKSESVAKAHAELTPDPYSTIIAEFGALVARIRQPIIVFIDDLDRCDPAYVCDLLENIQTMLRSAPIIYLVAADRGWITTSFTKRYTDFAAHSENPARPLGYLFLDKLFQLSVNMPTLSSLVRKRFLNAILGVKPLFGEGADTNVVAPELIANELAEAKRLVANKFSNEELLGELEKAADFPIRQQAIRAAVARRMGQSEVRDATEHRLSYLAALIEPNPRSMKNLVSAVALNQSKLVLESRSFDLESLARWTIIERRWPLLADWLAQHPARISGALVTPDTADEPIDIAMRALMKSPDVSAVIAKHLDAQRLSALIG